MIKKYTFVLQSELTQKIDNLISYFENEISKGGMKIDKLDIKEFESLIGDEDILVRSELHYLRDFMNLEKVDMIYLDFKRNKVSVIVGRFQTNEIHKGHLELFKRASEVSDLILVAVGISAAVGTDKNPLSYEVVKQMVESIGVGSNIVAFPLYDNLSDLEWSMALDDYIEFMTPEHLLYSDVIIWGGRDNGIDGYYKGKHKTQTIDSVGEFAATKIRSQLGKAPINSEDFRTGVIYASQNRYPIVYSTVDVLVKKDGKYLVGKKGDKYCFVGGFVDCADKNIGDSAVRELEEETGITQFDSISYLGSTKIDDPRYRGTKDSIMTHCFLVENPKDLENEIQDKEFSSFAWFLFEELEFNLHEHHKPLLTFLQ